MAVTLTRLSGKGKFLGHSSNMEGYSVTEDSTPLLGHDSSGGAGTISVPVTSVADSVLFINNEIRLDDHEQGYTTGTARGLSVQDDQLTIAADSRLAKFVVQRTAAPVSGTLAQVIEYYFSLCGIEDFFIIDPNLDHHVAYPAWTDNVWNRLKQICVAEQIEISLVSGVIYVTQPRRHTANMERNSSIGVDIDSANLAQYVEVNYYNYAPVVNNRIWPNSKEALPSVISLGSYEEVQVELTTNVSLTSLTQPAVTSTANLLLGSDTGASHYRVHDGKKEVDPQWWTDNEGMMRARIDPDDNTRILLLIRAPLHPTDGSFRIGWKGDGEEYQNSLYIAGTGIKFDKQMVRTATGANPALVVDDVAQTIDNQAISSKEQAWRVALDAASAFAGPTFKIDVSSNGIHRDEETTSGRYLTATEFNGDHSGMTMTQFNAMYAGMTMDEFNFEYEQEFETDFRNQAFGNINGSRVHYLDNIFRIRSATITQDGIDYSAERDIMAEDFNTVYEGMTMDEFNAQWSGYTFDDFSVMPLRRT